MALKIRLRQQGRKNQITYRLVLSESRNPRDGKYIEALGWYNPDEETLEKSLNVHAERIQHWLDHGAVLTEKAANLIKRGAPQIMEARQKKQLEARAKLCEKRRLKRKKKETIAAGR